MFGDKQKDTITRTESENKWVESLEYVERTRHT